MPDLVRDSLSREMVDVAQQILDGARSGQIVGAVFGLQLKGRRYLVNVAGTLSRDPTLGRGVLATADDELARMVQGKVDSNTTL